MAITKTNFIEYTRCRRYIGLENIRKDKLDSKMTIEEYMAENEKEEYRELLGDMFDTTSDGEIDLTQKEDKELSAMMKYYKEVELESAYKAKRIFNGKFVYSENTYNQESFDFVHNGIRYLCYTDIYNENEKEINIIEVKSTTSRNYLEELKYGENSKDKRSMFILENGIYKLNKPVNGSEKLMKSFDSKYKKLFDRYSDTGKYVFDLAVQRYIIENDLKSHGIKRQVNYYLSVLNHNYVYDGYMVGNKRIYRTIDGEDIVSFFDMNLITEEYMPIIELMVKTLEDNIYNPDSSKCNVGIHCSYKKKCECKYRSICFKELPEYNASFNYVGFSDSIGLGPDKYNKYDLINNGYFKLDDIPIEWILNKPNMLIERDCYDNDKTYLDKEKIKAMFDTLEYPIYHLDFESFPCPMPRFKGERPYTQSCFEFSLHIEHEPGVCDKDKDNYVFLADTLNDERLEMVKEIVKRIDPSKGTMFAQNVTFERSRLKELAYIFPEYKEHLLKIVEKSTDLIYFIKNNQSMYESLGFDTERSKLINFYHKDLSGSYSIKKTLPVLSDLTYKNLEVKNGTEALVTYSLYDDMTPDDLEKAKKNLRIYCKQDTWAMVVILDALRKLVNDNR